MARILVVDPDPSTCRLMCTALAMSGHLVYAASEVELADEELRRNRYDGLILDVTLPSLRGLWLGKLVDSEDRILRHTILTATLPDVEHVAQLAALPVFAIFAKPFELADFTAAIYDCVRQDDAHVVPRIYAREIYMHGDNPFRRELVKQ